MTLIRSFDGKYYGKINIILKIINDINISGGSHLDHTTFSSQNTIFTIFVLLRSFDL